MLVNSGYQTSADSISVFEEPNSKKFLYTTLHVEVPNGSKYLQLNARFDAGSQSNRPQKSRPCHTSINYARRVRATFDTWPL